MDALDAAWDAVHEALPARWHVGLPSVSDPLRRTWSVTAVGPHPGRGKMPQTVTGTGYGSIGADTTTEPSGNSKLAARPLAVARPRSHESAGCVRFWFRANFANPESAYSRCTLYGWSKTGCRPPVGPGPVLVLGAADDGRGHVPRVADAAVVANWVCLVPGGIRLTLAVRDHLDDRGVHASLMAEGDG